MRAISIVAAALVLAAPAAAHSLTAAQTHVLKHRFQLSTYKVAAYEGRWHWLLRPSFQHCAQIRFAKPRGTCFKHREGYRWHRERMERIHRILWPPPPPPVREVSSSRSALCGPACIQCESGGDPGAVSPDGKYWGLYQFDYGTWVAHGGAGSEYGHAGAERQHQVASRIDYDAWPNC